MYCNCARQVCQNRKANFNYLIIGEKLVWCRSVCLVGQDREANSWKHCTTKCKISTINMQQNHGRQFSLVSRRYLFFVCLCSVLEYLNPNIHLIPYNIYLFKFSYLSMSFLQLMVLYPEKRWLHCTGSYQTMLCNFNNKESNIIWLIEKIPLRGNLCKNKNINLICFI